MMIFIRLTDIIPVTTESEVHTFGTAILGLDSNLVQRSIANTKESLDPSKAAADLLQYWLEHNSESTAQDLLTAMEKSRFTATSVHAFEKFLKTQEYQTGV